MKKVMVVILTILFIIVILVTLALYFIGNYLYHLALNPNTSKEMILSSNNLTEEEQIQKIETQKWLEEKSRDVYITSEDGVKLHAYEMKNISKSDIWVIAIHGYTGSGEQMILAGKKYFEMGYNVLAIDLRGHGKSEGNYIGMGWPDRLDVIKWISYIIQEIKKVKLFYMEFLWERQQL